MTTPATPTRPALPQDTWSASMSSPGLSTPTRLTSTSSNAGAAGRGNPLSLRLYKILGARYEDESTREVLEILSGMYAPAATFDAQLPSSSAAPPDTGAGGNWQLRGGVVLHDGVVMVMVGRGGGGERRERRGDGRLCLCPHGDCQAHRYHHPYHHGCTGGNDSAARARKNLKRDVEMKMARSSRLFLSAFREVDKVRLMVSRCLFWRTDGSFFFCRIWMRSRGMSRVCRRSTIRRMQELGATNDACKFILERAEGLRVQR
jgi:hypothetical protein